MFDLSSVLSQVFAVAPAILEALMAVIAAASAVVAMTPTPRDDRFVGRLYRVLEILALNIGRAKELPANRRAR